MGYEEELKEVAVLGIDVMRDYLASKKHSDDLDMDRVRIGTQAVGAFQKYTASKGANNALQFMVLRSISKDKEELKKLISGNMPKQLK